METFEEVADAFEEFRESVIARADTPGRLKLRDIGGTSLDKKTVMETRTVKRTSIPTKISFAGWNGTF